MRILASDDMWKMWAFDSGSPWWHFILRAVIVYIFVLVLLRLTGKRQVGQLAPFDLVLLLVLSNAVQNAMNGGDNSITAGVLSACTLVGINWLVGWATYKNRKLEKMIEGSAVMLVHNGHIDHKAMESVRMTVHELDSAIRAGGCTGVHEVRIAVLENSGDVTIIPHSGHEKKKGPDHATSAAAPAADHPHAQPPADKPPAN